jgi:hypothetical protein
MRAKIAVFLVLAGGVAGCASTPPPAPMAMAEPAPMPAPMPAMTGPVAGTYKGPVVATDDSRASCRKMPASASTRVRDNTFMLGGMRGKVASDGSVMATPRHGSTMTGSLNNGTLDVTTMSHGCGYHYTLAHS